MVHRRPAAGASKKLAAETIIRKAEFGGAYEVNLRPQDSLYSATAEPTGRREPNQAFEDRPTAEETSVSTRARSVHDFSIMQRDLTEFVYTEVGCPRCDFTRTHGGAKGCGYAHSVVCRSRIKKALG